MWLGDLPAETKENVFKEMKERGYHVPKWADGRVRYVFYHPTIGTALFTDNDREFYDWATAYEEIFVDEFLSNNQNNATFNENDFMDLLLG